MKVRDIMSQPARCVLAFHTAEQAAELMAVHDVGVLPVTDDQDRVIGIVTDRDIVVRCLAQGLSAATVSVQQIMTAVPTTISPDESIPDAAFVLKQLRAHRLPVVDEGRLVGMLSTDDIVRYSEDDNMAMLMLRRVVPQRPRQSVNTL
jgi:CBS domain-containing protein